MSTPTVLTFGQPIRAARWLGSFATTFSVEGSVRRDNAGNRGGLPPRDMDAIVKRAVDLGHPLAGSIFIGHAITARGPASDIRYHNERLQYEAAEVLEPGQLVSIEGRLYTTSFPQKGNLRDFPALSDPIHFTPVEA